MSNNAPQAGSTAIIAATKNAYEDVGGYPCSTAGSGNNYTRRCIDVYKNTQPIWYPLEQYGQTAPDDANSGAKAAVINPCPAAGADGQPECFKLVYDSCPIVTTNKTFYGVPIWQNPDVNPLNPNKDMRTACRFQTKYFTEYLKDNETAEGINYLISTYGDSSGALTAELSKPGGLIDTYCAGTTTTCAPGVSSCSRFNSTDTNTIGICSAYARSYPLQADAIKEAYCNNPDNKDSKECSCINRNDNATYNTFKEAVSGNAGCWWNPCKDANPSTGVLSTSDISTTNCPNYCNAIVNFVANNSSIINIDADVKSNISCFNNTGENPTDTEAKTMWERISEYVASNKGKIVIGILIVSIITFVFVLLYYVYKRKSN